MCHQHNIFRVLDDGILIFPISVSLTRSMYGVVDSECSWVYFTQHSGSGGFRISLKVYSGTSGFW